MIYYDYDQVWFLSVSADSTSLSEVINLIIQSNERTHLAVIELRSNPSTPIGGLVQEGRHPLGLGGSTEDYIKALKPLQFGACNQLPNYVVSFVSVFYNYP